MLPFELVATATASPKYSPAGSLRKFGTAVKGISGTPVIVAFCWATAERATSSKTPAHAKARYRFMERPLTRLDDCRCDERFRQLRNVDGSLYQVPRRFNHHVFAVLARSAGDERPSRRFRHELERRERVDLRDVKSRELPQPSITV